MSEESQEHGSQHDDTDSHLNHHQRQDDRRRAGKQPKDEWECWDDIIKAYERSAEND